MDTVNVDSDIRHLGIASTMYVYKQRHKGYAEKMWVSDLVGISIGWEMKKVRFEMWNVIPWRGEEVLIKEVQLLQIYYYYNFLLNKDRQVR